MTATFRAIVCLAALLLPAAALAQQNQCRTSPVGTSTTYCASEALVASSRGVLTPSLFAGLAACASGTEGRLAAVTNSSTASYGATITGGGSNHVLAYCNGTNWTVH